MSEVYKKTENLFKDCLSILLPPKNMTVNEWADQNRVLTSESSKEAGQWETARTPYMLEVYESVTKDELRQMTLMMASQLAKSEFILNIFGRYVTLDPCPMLLVQPTDNMASAFSKERLDPMIRECQVVREKIKEAAKRGGDTILHKLFTGGFIAIIGTNSPANLAARPIRIAFMDEVDRYAISSGKEGSPIVLVKKRLQTYEDISKCIITGTPTVKGKSPVESEYENSSQGEWHLKCPKCNKYLPLKFPNLKWEDDDPSSVKMKCEYCGELSTEKEWKRNNQADGIWIHRHPERKAHLGYHLNALASVFRSWEDIVKEFNETKGDKEKLKAFINTVLAETWEEEPPSQDYKKLFQRREKYEAEIPDPVLILTAGIDVQKDWLALEVVGWAANGDKYGIQYKTIHGNLEDSKTWEKLDHELTKDYLFKDGSQLKIFASCIDTGGNHTQRVYDYVYSRQNRIRITGIKGQGGDAVPVNNGTRKTEGKGRNVSIGLLSVGVNALKDITYGSLDIKKGDAGYWHFPKNKEQGYDIEYFMSLTAEVKTYKNKKPEWIKLRERNEALDCRNYALVPFYKYTINWENLATFTREKLYLLSLYDPMSKAVPRSKISKKGVEID